MENFTTTNLKYKIATTENLTKEEIIENSVFVLEQGWDKVISECAMSGASIVLPNLHMGYALLAQTIVRQGRTYIITTKKLWESLESVLEVYPEILKKLCIIFFDPNELSDIYSSMN